MKATTINPKLTRTRSISPRRQQTLLRSSVPVIAGLLSMLLLACGEAAPPQSATDEENNRGDGALIVADKGEASTIQATTEDVANFVNPFIGTSNFGATHPGAQLPHGLASVAPFNVAFSPNGLNEFEKDAAWNSRVYIKENKFLTGFSHANLSGVGCPDLGVVLGMPVAGALEFDPLSHGSTYRDEAASPGAYNVTLDRGDISVEATSTLRSGRTRFGFPEGEAHILVNLGLGLTNESGATARRVSDTEIEGSRMIGGFCYNPEDTRPLYFVARVNKKPEISGLYKKAPSYTGVEADWIGYDDVYKPYPKFEGVMGGDDIGAYFSFSFPSGGAVELAVGVSYVSMENARENLEAEQGARSFEETRQAARAAWNEKLQRVSVEAEVSDKTRLYTALYHTLIHPSILQDVNGEYPTVAGGVGRVENGQDRYTVFSLWDTYRTVHPLLSLIYPETQAAMVRSALDIYRESGWLPKWELLSMETDVMVGDPALPMIADTYRRGIRDFDAELALEAMKKHASTKGEENAIRPYMEDYLSIGYVPLDDEGTYDGSVASALEYYLADWAIDAMAGEMGRAEEGAPFKAQSMGYRNYFDPETGMLRPKQSNGAFYAAFDPEQGKNFEPVPGFVEGTAWNYRFYAPHDIPGLIELNGGEAAFLSELERLFETDNFDMANEPDINYPFLYNYIDGEFWRTGKRVRELTDTHFTTEAGGLPGNDDAGTLSAWLAFSLLGLYPVVPGEPDFAVFEPGVASATIALNPAYFPGGSVTLKNEVETGAQLSEIVWNGAVLDTPFIPHQELAEGGVLEFRSGVYRSGELD